MYIADEYNYNQSRSLALGHLPLSSLPKSNKESFMMCVYRSCVLHGSETWSQKRENELTLHRTEMRMIGWMWWTCFNKGRWWLGEQVVTGQKPAEPRDIGTVWQEVSWHKTEGCSGCVDGCYLGWLGNPTQMALLREFLFPLHQQNSET